MRFWLMGMAVVGSALLLAPLATQEGARTLPKPPFAYYHPSGKPAPKTRLRLVKLSERRDTSTDNSAWLARNGLSLPTYGMDLANNKRGRLPADAPVQVGEQSLIRAIEGRPHALLLFGPDYSGARYLMAWNPTTKQETYTLDFQSYLQPPSAPASEREFVEEGVQWAQEAEGVLYVSNFHRTYARSSRGKNGYITALDPKTGRIKWRSRPLVCNSLNFLVAGDAIITGYGFTNEPDYLYVLDRATGGVVQTIRVKTGPDALALKDGKLFVRCYDTNYVFRLKR